MDDHRGRVVPGQDIGSRAREVCGVRVERLHERAQRVGRLAGVAVVGERELDPGEVEEVRSLGGVEAQYAG